jgi:hypothetical protein
VVSQDVEQRDHALDDLDRGFVTAGAGIGFHGGLV